MTHLQIIIAEAALELIPKQIRKHPSIIKYAKKRGKNPKEILLDASYHHHAMKKLEEKWKRGRPDITHITLLHILGTPANLEGYIQTYVHTINDKVIYINPQTRLPRNYLRFTGLIEQLFIKGQVPPKTEKPLLKIQKQTLQQLLNKIKPTKTIILTTNGQKYTPWKIAKILANEQKPALIIGGFPHGTFKQQNLKLADIKATIYPKPLETWTVTALIIHAYEKEMKIYEKAWNKPQNFQLNSQV